LSSNAFGKRKPRLGDTSSQSKSSVSLPAARGGFEQAESDRTALSSVHGFGNQFRVNSFRLLICLKLVQWRAQFGVRFFLHTRFQRTVLAAAHGKHFTRFLFGTS
jgi:hypothetical protein